MLSYLLFVAGFVILIYGANWLVDGAASLARKYGISDIVIGLTIVALGTSSPELVVNLVASFKGTADVALGNVLGSNISNILLILGISAIIYPMSVNSNTQWKEVPLALLAALIIGVVVNDSIFDHESIVSTLYRSDGIVLIAFFVLFMIYAFGIAKKDDSLASSPIKSRSVWLSILMIGGGIGGLVLGGKWIVDGAVTIAGMLGMSEALISLTIVAVGTSLPELATCIAAALKRNPGIVVGNIIGSNIFNIFFVLGISAVIKPLPFNPSMNFDILIGIGASALLFAFLLFPRKRIIERWQGWVLVLLYVVYLLMLIFREGA